MKNTDVLWAMIDLEGAYFDSPSEVQKTVTSVIEAGSVGINFEDQIIGGKELYSVAEQCARIKPIHETVNYRHYQFSS